MKTFILLALSLTTTAVTANNEPKKVDVEKSTVKWNAAKVTGKHHGTVDLKEATLEFDNGTLVGGNFVVDMTSIVNEDLEGSYKAKLEGHLKSDDFFGVEKYPTASFTITDVEMTSAGMYKVTGDLTIKGITNPISFDASVKDNQASATLTVDRSKYNVRYGSNSFFDNLGDKAIYDDFDLTINLKY